MWLPARAVAPEARVDVVAFVARMRFDPKLRAELPPKQQSTVARPRHELADEF